MAEAVGVVASALTLLDSTIKILSLITKLKDVPTVLRTLTEQTEQLEDVIQTIQRSAALNPNFDTLASIIQSCTRDLSTFQTRLRSLAQGLEAGTIKNRWAAVKGVVKEKEFREAATKIEGHKTTLMLFLQNQYLSKADSLSNDLSTVQHGINYVAQGLPNIQTLALQMKNATVNTENSISRVSNTLSSVENIVGQNSAELRALRDIMIQQSENVRNLMMKPAALAQELDRVTQRCLAITELDDGKHISSSNALSAYSMPTVEAEPYVYKSMASVRCMCYRRPQTTAWRSPYRILGVGTLSMAQHRKTCPLSSFQSGFQISVRYMFPQWLLFKAVDISFSALYGAGGFSLAPYLGIIRVATNNNVAKKVLNRFTFVHDAGRLDQLILELRQVFLDGRASPFDIDEQGQSLIHSTIDLTPRDLRKPGLVVELVRFLKDCGTDIELIDFSGRSALAMYLQYRIEIPYLDLHRGSELESARTALLRIGTSVVADADSSNLTSCQSPTNLSRFANEMIQNLRASDEFAEDVMRCGPLSMAVLKRSETLVRYHLRNPAVFGEKNAAGQNALHLCGDWVKGIEILLEAGFPCDKTDNSHLTSLDYAISIQGAADAVRTLLKAGCPLACCGNPHGWNSTLDRVLCNPLDADMETKVQWPLSPKVSCLIDNIKYRRESLAVLAEKHSSYKFLNKIRILGTALDDTRAHCTWKALRRAGIKLPSSLRTRGVSVYHQVRSISLAKYLYNLGFKNVDEYDQHGRTPLMSLACRFEDFGVYLRDTETLEETLSLAKWFLFQGADPLRSCRDHSLNTLHIAAYYGTIETAKMTLLEQQKIISPATEKLFKRQYIDPIVFKIPRRLQSSGNGIRILNPLLLLIVQKASPTCHDFCRCGCSYQGCTPTISLLQGITGFHFNWQRNSLQLYEISALLHNWYNAVAAVGVSVRCVHEEVRRFIAFDKLELKHTCCRFYSSYAIDTFEQRPSTDDDFNQIREEEEELLNQLEDMLLDPDSDWWNSCSIFDILLDVNGEGPPPTLKWVNLWLISQAYGLDEEVCEELRKAARISGSDFWESCWAVPELHHCRLQPWENRGRCGEIQPSSTAIKLPTVRRCSRPYGDIVRVWIEFRS